MKRYLLGIIAALALSAVSISAHAANPRTFIIDPPNSADSVVTWKIYCGVTNVPSAFNTTPVATINVPAVTSGVVQLPDTVKFCAAVFTNMSGLPSPFSNVVSVTAPGAPVLRITSVDVFAWDDLLEKSGEQLSHMVQSAEIQR